MNWKQLLFISIVFAAWTLCGKLWDIAFIAFSAQQVEQGISPFIIGGICYTIGYEVMIKYGRLVHDKKIDY